MFIIKLCKFTSEGLKHPFIVLYLHDVPTSNDIPMANILNYNNYLITLFHMYLYIIQ